MVKTATCNAEYALAAGVIDMDIGEQWVRLCGQIGHFSERTTGINIVDAYFGPDELAPERQQKDRAPEDILHELESLSDRITDEFGEDLRRMCMLKDVSSLHTTVSWLSGQDFPYLELVERLLHVQPEAFPESKIEQVRREVEQAFSDFPGDDTADRVRRFQREGEIIGDDARRFIEVDLQKESTGIGEMFRTRVYEVIGDSVTDNGIEYRAVTDKPWGAYNWYMGDFRSVNEFNIDRPITPNTVIGAIYHEYEHHVSNLWREKAYKEHGWTDLSVVSYYTGHSVIAEGTADTAADFLGVGKETRKGNAARATSDLFRILSINAAIMMNQDDMPVEEVVDYVTERSFSPRERIEAVMGVMKPETADGRPNFFAPYVFAYYIGRNDYVYPTFVKARETNQLPKFFRTLYLNPYAASSVTWDEAFEWL
ncbi:MAG: hypothetical protein JSW05_06695 [Candidatus Thorarchaeota archaeon]|nr:MAG: hypothetical protein JSW05_06695 [Candidatus Thorarchaeota archaeon]